eukprot:scaffold1369_cov140-Isochrysis_galbana.AAC.1
MACDTVPPRPAAVIDALSALIDVGGYALLAVACALAITTQNSCVGFARDAQLSEGSAVHRHQVHDGEQQSGPLQEAAQHPNTQRDGMCKHRRRTHTAHPLPCTTDDGTQNLPAPAHNCELNT